MENTKTLFHKFKVVTERIKAWYERAESLEPTIFSEMKPSDLKRPLQLAEIAKNEEQLKNFDIGSMGFLFVEGTICGSELETLDINEQIKGS